MSVTLYTPRRPLRRPPEPATAAPPTDNIAERLAAALERSARDASSIKTRPSVARGETKERINEC
jgi:hypothetical protein